MGCVVGIEPDDGRDHNPERYHCATRTTERIVGLRGEARTPDPMLPKHVRCQLRHAEKKTGSRGWERSNGPRLIKTVLCH